MEDNAIYVKVCKCGSLKFKCLPDEIFVCEDCKRVNQYIEEKENDDGE